MQILLRLDVTIYRTVMNTLIFANTGTICFISHLDQMLQVLFLTLCKRHLLWLGADLLDVIEVLNILQFLPQVLTCIHLLKNLRVS